MGADNRWKRQAYMSSMTDEPKAPETDSGSTTVADLKDCEATADLWVKLEAEAAAGDARVENFLIMFRPFAAERLGQRPKS